MSPSRFGIRCNAVLPGFVCTPMSARVPSKVLAKVGDVGDRMGTGWGQ